MHPDEHPVSIQLFGHDPDVMRSAARDRGRRRRRPDRHQHGLPRAARSARPGPARRCSTTPRSRSRSRARRSRAPASRSRSSCARASSRATARGSTSPCGSSRTPGVAAIAFHPRPASVQHKGAPDYELVRELVELVDVPVIVSGGLRSAERAARRVRRVRSRRRDARARLARQPVGLRAAHRAPDGATRARGDRRASCSGSIDRAEEHFGAQRAAPLPAQVLPLVPRAPRRCRDGARAVPAHHDLDEVRALVRGLAVPVEAVAALAQARPGGRAAAAGTSAAPAGRP